MTAMNGTTGGMNWRRIHNAPLVIFPVSVLILKNKEEQPSNVRNKNRHCDINKARCVL